MIRGAVCGLAYALLYGLSLPSAGGPQVFLWVLALLAPFPLGWCALVPGNLRYRALGAAIGSIPLWSYTHWWISDVSMLGFPPLVLVLSLYTGMFVLIFGTVMRKHPKLPIWIMLPIAWACAEMLRGRIIMGGYPWYFLGVPTIDSSAFRLFGSLGGIYFVGAMACVPSAIALSIWHNRKRAPQSQPLRKKLVCRALIGLCLAGVPLILAVDSIGAWILRQETLTQFPRSTVIILQTNLPMSQKMQWKAIDRARDLERYIDMTKRAIENATTIKPFVAEFDDGTTRTFESQDPPKSPHPPVQMIIWPETMFPGLTLSPDAVRVQREANMGWKFDDGTQLPETWWHDRLVQFQQEVGIPIVIGAVSIENLRAVQNNPKRDWDFDRMGNAAFLIEHGEVQPVHYDKLKLTPFGEEMPIISRWEWLEKQLLAFGASGMSFDLDRGRSAVTLPHTDIEADEPLQQSVQLATPICFEATVPEVCRRLVRSGRWKSESGRAIMVNLTNDGWFGDSDRARAWHLLHARWRCVELGTPMIRAANTGTSTVINEFGLLQPPMVIESDNPKYQLDLPRDEHSMPRDHKRIPAQEFCALAYDWPVYQHNTLYYFTGNIWGWGCVGVTALLLVPKRKRDAKA
ncbi:MAG: apolipoprotein N-acyltransferase [Phycisphaerales bacterium]